MTERAREGPRSSTAASPTFQSLRRQNPRFQLSVSREGLSNRFETTERKTAIISGFLILPSHSLSLCSSSARRTKPIKRGITPRCLKQYLGDVTMSFFGGHFSGLDVPLFPYYFIKQLERFSSVPAAVQVLRLFIHLLFTALQSKRAVILLQCETSTKWSPSFPLA